MKNNSDRSIQDYLRDDEINWERMEYGEPRGNPLYPGAHVDAVLSKEVFLTEGFGALAESCIKNGQGDDFLLVISNAPVPMPEELNYVGACAAAWLSEEHFTALKNEFNLTLAIKIAFKDNPESALYRIKEGSMEEIRHELHPQITPVVEPMEAAPSYKKRGPRP